MNQETEVKIRKWIDTTMECFEESDDGFVSVPEINYKIRISCLYELVDMYGVDKAAETLFYFGTGFNCADKILGEN